MPGTLHSHTQTCSPIWLTHGSWFVCLTSSLTSYGTFDLQVFICPPKWYFLRDRCSWFRLWSFLYDAACWWMEIIWKLQVRKNLMVFSLVLECQVRTALSNSKPITTWPCKTCQWWFGDCLSRHPHKQLYYLAPQENTLMTWTLSHCPSASQMTNWCQSSYNTSESWTFETYHP